MKRVLIANRGEIALRILRAADALGIDAVGFASEVDKESLFARQAKELVVVKSSAPKDSYLNVEKILTAAKERGCDAIHPGYGFLSENADFAAAVEKAGLIFIGPTSNAIRILGSKTAARETVSRYQVPCVPGSRGGLTDGELMEDAARIGFPVLVKAAGGGGGRGMRVFNSQDEMKGGLPRARAEAEKYFGDGNIYLERYIVRPKHIEVQVFGDSFGNLVHFGTRECSVQRRHQKVIEEAPAITIAPTVREKIQQAALRAAKSVGYRNAGTVEFLVSGDEFYFLEMNTRIQVEHPVTELVTGTDLVQLQFKIAMGERLPEQADIKFSGHAFEFRLCAEDPRREFAPATGTIEILNRPQHKNLREDFGYEAGDRVTPYYDGLLGKIIVSAGSRAQAIALSREILSGYQIEGLPTTLEFHRWALLNREFIDGTYDIGFVSREFTKPNEALDALKAAQIKDPLHRTGPAGSEVVEVFRYRSAAFGQVYEIQLLHRADGVFVASPVRDGTLASAKNRRASNGLNCAVRSLIEDVLEKLPPELLFQ